MSCQGTRRFVSQFQSFREKKTFVDLSYPNRDGTEAYGHRLVFARCSQFYEELFARFPPSEGCYACPVPLEHPNRFTELVDFFYEKKFVCGTVDLSLLGEFLVTSAFYGVSSLHSMLCECVVDILSGKTENARLAHVLEKPQDVLLMTEPFAKFRVQEIPELKELIDEGKKRVKETEKIFQEFVGEHVQTLVASFKDAGMGRLDCLSPGLMLRVFEGMEVEDKRKVSKTKAKFIESYVEKLGCGASEMEAFSRVIDWSEPGIEKLLVKHKLRWVEPKTCRKLLGALFRRRRAMTHEMERIAKAENQNWPTLSLLNQIANLKADNCVDVIDFISTYGGLCTPKAVEIYRRRYR